MKLSADKDHADYHDVVHFVDQLYVGGQLMKSCVHIDTELNEAQCIAQPVTIENDHVLTHVIKGKIEIIWKLSQSASNKPLLCDNNLFLYLKKDWEQRELLRKQEQHAI
jgi:hypothetical protein